MAAFTLVELMLSMAIIVLLIVVLASITGQASSTWRYTTAKVEQFRGARAAFETVTTRLSQATLNTYWDYDNVLTPTRYQRQSELRFVSGPATTLLGDTAQAKRVTHCVFFHAPLGMTDTTQIATALDPGYRGLENLLNVWGYYVELSDDRNLRPDFLTEKRLPYRYRFRLMECMQPSEKLRTYNYTSGGTAVAPLATTYKTREWFTDFINQPNAPVRLLGENIIALIITPRLAKKEEQAFNLSADISPLAPTYSYDTTATSVDTRINPHNQLPPVVQITMVAIDETSASRLNNNLASADIFNLSNKFKDTKNYTRDLTLNPLLKPADSLENQLVALKLSYRVFTTNVPIRAAKWSREQAN